MLNRALLYINTIKYLRVSQILNRVKRKFIKPKIKLLKTPKLSNSINAMQSTIQHSQRMYGKGSFDKNVGKILEKHTYSRTNEVMTMVK